MYVQSYIKLKMLKKLIRKKIKRYVITPIVVKSYLKNNQIKKLHIAAGKNYLAGWLNTDIVSKDKRVVYLDATKAFPFKNNTFDYIFSEHLIEHLTYEQGRRMLCECHRVLKPNGKIRLATPDLKTFINLFTNDKTDIKEQYIKWSTDKFLPELAKLKIYSAAFVINIIFYKHGHQFIYDIRTLTDSLKQAGFKNIVRCAYGESNNEFLKGIDSHDQAVNNEEMVRFETLILEATKITS